MTCLKIEVKVFKANNYFFNIKHFCYSISGTFFAGPFLSGNANQELLENIELCGMDNLIG